MSQINVRLDYQLRKRFRMVCLEEDKAMNEVIVQMIQERLSKREAQKARKEGETV